MEETPEAKLGNPVEILRDQVISIQKISSENITSDEIYQNKKDSFLVEHSKISLGDLEIWCKKGDLRDLLKVLKNDKKFLFNLFISVTVIDWMDSARERFEIVYHLLCTTNLNRIRVRAWVSENDSSVESVSDLWPGADFMEREVWDMYGISFSGHKNLRRILMYDEFSGHPLRKDYPVQGKQPRISLRAPEVRNTAVDMKRPELVSINPRRRG